MGLFSTTTQVKKKSLGDILSTFETTKNELWALVEQNENEVYENENTIKDLEQQNEDLKSETSKAKAVIQNIVNIINPS